MSGLRRRPYKTTPDQGVPNRWHVTDRETGRRVGTLERAIDPVKVQIVWSAVDTDGRTVGDNYDTRSAAAEAVWDAVDLDDLAYEDALDVATGEHGDPLPAAWGDPDVLAQYDERN